MVTSLRKINRVDARSAVNWFELEDGQTHKPGQIKHELAEWPRFPGYVAEETALQLMSWGYNKANSPKKLTKHFCLTETKALRWKTNVTVITHLHARRLGGRSG